MTSTAVPPSLLTLMAGHFSGDAVPESTRIWVEALRQISTRLVLVFDNPAPTQIPASWQDEGCTALFEPHGEYDFGSYKRGLQWADQQGLLQASSHVLICNDSIYGPLTDLACAIAPMLQRTDEAWALTESLQLTPHLQSFFLLFGSSVLQTPSIRRLFDQVQRQPHRQALIEAYELGLSKALLAEGFQLKALVPAHQRRLSLSGQPMLNPTAWPLTSVSLGLPVIKKKALIDELANEEGFAETSRLLARRNPALWQAVLQESPHWRLWCHHLSLGILLNNGDLTDLASRLEWLGVQLCCRWMLILPVAPSHWPELQDTHADAIADGHLQLVPPDEAAGDVFSALLACQEDWIVLATASLWHQPHRLAMVQRQLIREPQRDLFPGDPVVVRRQWWLRRGAHRRLLGRHQHEQVWLRAAAAT